MKRVPSLDLYNEAVQNPRVAFSDSQLRGGTVQTNGLGLPLALGGGFAITYNIRASGRTFAVRVFHKDSAGLESRYRSVSAELSRVASPYFVQFEYQANGIIVNGSPYPIVKMEWAAGETLGSYLETRYSDRSSMQVLQRAFRELASHLRSRGIAHGDVQTGNVMVDGSRIRLIDYDGMFVPGMSKGNGAEIGHRHFQHPARAAADFCPAMDRFSFIAVDLTLSALAERSSLFPKFATTGENILFTSNDFQDPGASPLFAELRAIPSLRKTADDFAAVCRGPVTSIPDLDDFVAGRNIPSVVVVVSTQPRSRAAYAGSLPVIDALDFSTALSHVGDRVELIGRVTDVKIDLTRRGGREYVFINFGDWRGQIIKVNIWSTGLAKLRRKPDPSWIGQWISVTGMVDPPYSNARYSYTHLSITVEESQQLHILGSDEAQYRLSSRSTQRATGRSAGGNRDVLENIRQGAGTRGGPVLPRPTARTITRKTARSKNRELLDRINAGTTTTSGQPWRSGASHTPQHASKPSGDKPIGCIVMIVIVVVIVILANMR